MNNLSLIAKAMSYKYNLMSLSKRLEEDDILSIKTKDDLYYYLQMLLSKVFWSINSDLVTFKNIKDFNPLLIKQYSALSNKVKDLMDKLDKKTINSFVINAVLNFHKNFQKILLNIESNINNELIRLNHKYEISGIKQFNEAIELIQLIEGQLVFIQ